MNLKDWVNRLVWATVLVTVVRYSAAFMASDVGQITGFSSEVVTFFLTLTGLGMGILDTLGGGLLFNGWSKVFPKAGTRWSMKFKILTFCVFSLVISGMIILVPFTMSRLAHISVLDALGGRDNLWSWIWAGMVNFIPYILIIGVFAGNRMVTDLESSESYQKVTKRDEKVTSNLPTDWRKILPSLSPEQVKFIANAEPKMIVYEMSLSKISISPRTASNWRLNARKHLGIDSEST